MVNHSVKRSVKRFGKYGVIGILTFALDLFLLYLLTDTFKINYILAAGASFIFAVSINYFLSRRFVFHGSTRSMHGGYAIFILIAGVGLLIVTGGMALLVGVFHWYYLLARIVIAGFVGFWNYLMNLYVNFQVHKINPKNNK